MKVLIFGAHADDDALGMGGTIAWHAYVRGDQVASVVITDSSSTQYPGDYVKAEAKRKEALAAARVLGIQNFHHMHQPDMRLDTIPHVEINAIVERFVRDMQPDIVYCPHPDVNKDHVAVFDSVMVATRPVPGQPVRGVCTYPLISSTEWAASISPTPFIPNRYVDIEHTLIFKLIAMSCYATELRDYPHPRSLQGIRVYAQSAGIEIGVRYAERFCIIRHLDMTTTPQERDDVRRKLSPVLASLGVGVTDTDAAASLVASTDLGQIGSMAGAMVDRMEKQERSGPF